VVTGTTGQPNAEEAVQAIARHLERAKAAADQQGLSLAEWLSRAILTNTGTGETSVSRRAASSPPATTPVAELPATQRNSPAASRSDPPSAAPRLRARTGTPPAPEAPLPEASSVRDVLSRAGKSEKTAAAAESAEPAAAIAVRKPRRSTAPLWVALAILTVVAAGIWALPEIQKRLGGATETAASAAEPPKAETAALPDSPPPKPLEPAKPEAAPPAKPETAKAPEPAKPPEVAKAPEAANPPAPPAKPAEKADSLPAPAPAKPPEAKPAEKAALPDTPPEADLSRVPAKDMPKPPSAHIDWYKKAAEADNAEAQYALGELYLKGDGVPRSFPAAAQMFRRAAEKGNLARAQYALGLLYQRGLGVPKNEVEAVLWWQRAADQNFSAAITYVGIALLDGKGIQKDEEAARKMLERAADLDEPNAQYTLCRVYERGIGTKKDQVLAMKWCILAAEQAHPQATQKVEEFSTTMPRDLQERATERVSEHYRNNRKRR
jgi:TPR repeat protein